MKKGFTKYLGMLLVLAMIIGLVPTSSASAKAAKTKTITVLETSDIHGMLMNHDYATDTPVDKGLVQAATIIKQERKANPDLLLVDCGDTTQGNMVSEFRNDEIHPAVAALNYLKYDAWELGNHEFNYEFSNLKKNIKAFKGTVLGGNIYKKNGKRFVKPYIIKKIDGVKVAIFGIEAPHITRWESDKSHYNNMTFTTPMDETEKILDELEAKKCDVIIGLYHYGEDGEYELEGKGGMYQVAEKYADRVDAFLIGHAHSTFTKYLVNGKWIDSTSEDWKDSYLKKASTCMIETGTNVTNVGKLTIEVKKSGKSYKVVSKKVENLSTAGVKADNGLKKALKKVHKASVELANKVVGQVAEDFHENPQVLPGIPSEVIEDGPVLDLIHKVQLAVTGADVSCAALFDANSNLKKGDYKLKDGVNVYKYDNTLMAVECTGAQLKAVMEKQAGNFFNQFKEGDITISFNENIRLYNYDTFQGVDYEIDISEPAGSRIKNVMYKGAPLKDDQKLILALNNYRFGGLTGDGLLDADKKCFDSAATLDVPAVRDIISNYIADQGGVKPESDGNWKITGFEIKKEDAAVAAEVYKMVEEGKIVIPSSADGRTSNIKALNLIELRKEGIIK